jgi:serine/threonine protein kinase
MENELEILQTFHHPHVIDYVDHIRKDERELWIFTEFCEYGDLETGTTEYGSMVPSFWS